MTFTGPFEDRLAIHELVATYGDAVTCRDGNAWADCWAEDAVWSLPAIPGMERIEGRAAILAAWLAAMPGWPHQVNIQTLGAVAIDGDTATGHVYTAELNTDTAGLSQRWTGKYTDTYSKAGGRWWISSRSYEVLHIGVA
jgi:uncharacterized protein (TIGR02246 family)